jgi:flagellar basal body-associated protein FliL
MAEEAKKKTEAPPAAAPAADKKEPAKTEKAKAGGLLTKTPVLLGGVMVLEAAVLIGGFKFLNRGPQTAQGASLATDKPTGDAGKPDDKKVVEIPVVEFRAPNKQSGRTFLYDVNLFVVVKEANAEHVKTVFKDRDATVKDRIRTIIAQCDPEKLGGGSEPGLETLRRQIKYQLDEILGGGESQIEEVLVARCIPFRADY